MAMRVAVLGGGLQGACAALELAASGVDVDVYDKNERCLTQASAQNEGKIHLGYVYANDPSLRTARAMVRGTVAFAPLLRRWVGDAIDTVPVSAPFYYAVHAGSLLTPDEVEHHLRSSHALALEEGGGAAPDYFGADYRVRPERLSRAEAAGLFDPRTVAAAFRTPEVGVDPEALAAVVRARLHDHPRLRCVHRAFVHGAAPDAGGVTVDVEVDGARFRERDDHAVNTLWDGRLAVDHTAGIAPERPWMWRVRHYLRLNAPGLAAAVPSVTIVLGAFGDVVAYGNDGLYLSWYPAGKRGASSARSPPPWPLTLGASDADAVREGILGGLAGIVPAVADLSADALASCEVKGGIIFAWGQTDIDDRASGLHERHAIGPRSYGRYHTVDTGKLTMAPLFGKLVADRIRLAA
jgi:hypothetical protein